MSDPGLDLAGILGFLDIIGAVYCLCMSVGNTNKRVKKSSSPKKSVSKTWELVICPIFLLLSGLILSFGGWRLDPIMQLQQLFLHLIVGVALAKQTNSLVRDRQ